MLNQLGTLAEGLDKATTYEDLKRTKERPSGLSVGFRRTSVENPRKEYYAAAFVTTGKLICRDGHASATKTRIIESRIRCFYSPAPVRSAWTPKIRNRRPPEIATDFSEMELAKCFPPITAAPVHIPWPTIPPRVTPTTSS